MKRLQVLGRKLQLSFTAWGECGAACGVGYNDRTAICANVDGIPVDVSACSSYTGQFNTYYCLIYSTKSIAQERQTAAFTHKIVNPA